MKRSCVAAILGLAFLVFPIATIGGAIPSNQQLPFVPPVGWQQVDPDAIAQIVAMWYRRAGTGKNEMQSVVIRASKIVPGEMPRLVRMTTTSSSHPSVQPTPHRLHFTSRAQVHAYIQAQLKILHEKYHFIGTPLYHGYYTVCGTQGMKQTMRVPTPDGAVVEIMDFIRHDGYFYIISYTRADGAQPDMGAVSIIDTFCPGTPAQVAAHAPPHGWQAIQAPRYMKPIAFFMSMKTQGSLVLYEPVLRLPRTTAAALNTLRQVQPVTDIKAVSAQIGDLCGNTAIFFENRYVEDFYPVIDESAMTSTTTTLYDLEYIRQAGTPADPSAIASFRTLCAGKMPDESGPESPYTPSPSPSASP